MIVLGGFLALVCFVSGMILLFSTAHLYFSGANNQTAQSINTRSRIMKVSGIVFVVSLIAVVAVGLAMGS